MENQEKFIELMQDIKALAKMNQRKTTKEFVRSCFQDMALTEEQMAYVYDYLQQENIRVEGYEGKHKEKQTVEVSEENTEESRYLSMYLDEVEQVGSHNQISEEMYRRAARGEEEAKSHVIHQKLSRVAEIAGRFLNQGISRNDLIQEGNMGLLLAVNELEGHEKEEDAFLDDEIEKSILNAIDIYKAERQENKSLMKRAENLKDEMERLEEDFGDKMTSDDVAQFTGMDLEEIQDILRMTGEDI